MLLLGIRVVAVGVMCSLMAGCVSVGLGDESVASEGVEVTDLLSPEMLCGTMALNMCSDPPRSTEIAWQDPQWAVTFCDDLKNSVQLDALSGSAKDKIQRCTEQIGEDDYCVRSFHAYRDRLSGSARDVGMAFKGWMEVRPSQCTNYVAFEVLIDEGKKSVAFIVPNFQDYAHTSDVGPLHSTPNDFIRAHVEKTVRDYERLYIDDQRDTFALWELSNLWLIGEGAERTAASEAAALLGMSVYFGKSLTLKDSLDLDDLIAEFDARRLSPKSVRSERAPPCSSASTSAGSIPAKSAVSCETQMSEAILILLGRKITSFGPTSTLLGNADDDLVPLEDTLILACADSSDKLVVWPRQRSIHPVYKADAADQGDKNRGLVHVMNVGQVPLYIGLMQSHAELECIGGTKNLLSKSTDPKLCVADTSQSAVVFPRGSLPWLDYISFVTLGIVYPQEEYQTNLEVSLQAGPSGNTEIASIVWKGERQ